MTRNHNQSKIYLSDDDFFNYTMGVHFEGIFKMFSPQSIYQNISIYIQKKL